MKQADLPADVFRLGRRPDPWSWPDWAFAEADGTFGNRYDDPQGIYRVLYASTQRVATFVECLAYYRPDIEVVAGLQVIVGDDGDDEPPAAGVVPAEWVDQRCVGRGALVGDYADVGHHESLAELRTALAARVVHHGLHDLDAATIRLTAPRAFTQDVSRYIFEQTAAGQRRWNGLCYLSKHGDDLTNWAVFEPAAPDVIDVASSTATTPTCSPRSLYTTSDSSNAPEGSPQTGTGADRMSHHAHLRSNSLHARPGKGASHGNRPPDLPVQQTAQAQPR